MKILRFRETISSGKAFFSKKKKKKKNNESKFSYPQTYPYSVN